MYPKESQNNIGSYCYFLVASQKLVCDFISEDITDFGRRTWEISLNATRFKIARGTMQVANVMKKSIVLTTCHTNELQQDRHAKIILKAQ